MMLAETRVAPGTAWHSVHSEFEIRPPAPPATLNAAIECCDRHVPEAIALRCEDEAGRSRTFTFAQLRSASSRFAHLLVALGVGPGDTVAVMLPRTVELMIALLGTLRMGAVYQPLFTAFGPKAVEHRVTSSGAKVVVTDDANRVKLESLPAGVRIVRVSDAADHGDIDFHGWLVSCRTNTFREAFDLLKD